MIRILSLIGILLGALLTSCGRETGPVDAEEPVVPAVEPTLAELVVANCYLVQSAAIRFALENGNEYPHAVDDVSVAGHTLVDLLPDTASLDNPVTGGKTEPADYTAWRPGETAYRPLWAYEEMPGRLVAIGYVITGYADSSRCVTLSNLPPSYYEKDERTIENCCAVMRAAEAFAEQNNGWYPHNVGVDRTPLGNTLIDFLPDGLLMENPYHLCRTEPIDGAAAQQGETGYLVCIDGDRRPSGYVITGAGTTYDCIIQICRECE